MKKPLATSPSQEVSSDEDAIRAYYRKLGRVALLTREGEIVLAQRIESAEARIVRALVGSGVAVRELASRRRRARALACFARET